MSILGQTLQGRGHKVSVLARLNAEARVRARGLNFISLGSAGTTIGLLDTLLFVLVDHKDWVRLFPFFILQRCLSRYSVRWSVQVMLLLMINIIYRNCCRVPR